MNKYKLIAILVALGMFAGISQAGMSTYFSDNIGVGISTVTSIPCNINSIVIKSTGTAGGGYRTLIVRNGNTTLFKYSIETNLSSPWEQKFDFADCPLFTSTLSYILVSNETDLTGTFDKGISVQVVYENITATGGQIKVLHDTALGASGIGNVSSVCANNAMYIYYIMFQTTGIAVGNRSIYFRDSNTTVFKYTMSGTGADSKVLDFSDKPLRFYKGANYGADVTDSGIEISVIYQKLPTK
jgi:hypothetical protein